MPRRSNKHLKFAEYEQIKALLGFKIPISKVADVSGRSLSTINWIKQSSTFIEYKEIIRLSRIPKEQPVTQIPVISMETNDNISLLKAAKEFHESLVALDKVLQTFIDELPR